MGKLLPFLALSLSTLTCFIGLSAQDTASGPWVMQSSGTSASFRGIHAVGGGVAWASGTNGTVLRTEDSGYMWQSCAMPPGAEKLDFRGIWAWDADMAVVMSSGPGDQSRLYKTTDGCSHWTLLYTNPDKDGFWDAVLFLDRRQGVILGDPTTNAHGEKQFTILRTIDAGATWLRDDFMSNEAAFAVGLSAFAASNTAAAISDNDLWFGTGGKGGAIAFSENLYDKVASTGKVFCDCAGPLPGPRRIAHWFHIPLEGGTDSSGIFSLAFRDSQHGMAVGGDYQKPNESAGTAAWTADGGEHWTAAMKPPHGYRSAVAWDAEARAWITVGPNGSDISDDDGKTWQALDDGNWNALSLPWVVGPKGRMAKLDEGRLKRLR